MTHAMGRTGTARPERRRREDGEETYGPAADGDGPMRLCALNRTGRSRDDLLRFVTGPGGVLVPDPAGRLPGRGVWVTAERRAVEAAVQAKVFARSLKRAIAVPGDLADEAERLLVRRALEALSLANKAGLAVTGFTRVNAALDGGQVMVLIHGRDAAGDGCAKLSRKYEAVCREGGREPQKVTDFTIAQLSLALGRENVVHAALAGGGAAGRFLIAARRVRQYRGEPDSSQ